MNSHLCLELTSLYFLHNTPKHPSSFLFVSSRLPLLSPIGLWMQQSQVVAIV